jgi:hypothetical protein
MFQDQWWALYQHAVLEMDGSNFDDRLQAAEDAIVERLSLKGRVPAAEWSALQNALAGLEILRKERKQHASHRHE